MVIHGFIHRARSPPLPEQLPTMGAAPGLNAIGGLALDDDRGAGRAPVALVLGAAAARVPTVQERCLDPRTGATVRTVRRVAG
jgi:hypothetical protein